MSDPLEPSLYARAGVDDPAEFYRTKFVSDEVLDARYFSPLNRFDMRFARTMWVYDNVRADSAVLDLGCGAGMLALLKRKGVTLTGIDLSPECTQAARRNGYDEVSTGALTSLPFAAASFDYVVSLDVLGHVESAEKDTVIDEIKRVLRPAGVTLHGIECIDSAARRTYEEMSAAELRRFISIDGHVGLEEEEEHAARFRRCFAHVEWEPRYTLCLSSDEFLKQADEYGLPFEADFLSYLRGLSAAERRAFDMAMGYVFGKVSDLQMRLPKSGLYVFLKASARALGSFYNEHRDRRALLRPALAASRDDESEPAGMCLDRHPDADFDGGWHEPQMLPPIARWMGESARVSFNAPSVSLLSFDLTTHMPDLSRLRPLSLEVRLNGVLVAACALYAPGWLELCITLATGEVAANVGCKRAYELSLRAGRTWQPRPGDTPERDDRQLSIAVCNLQVRF